MMGIKKKKKKADGSMSVMLLVPKEESVGLVPLGLIRTRASKGCNPLDEAGW